MPGRAPPPIPEPSLTPQPIRAPQASAWLQRAPRKTPCRQARAIKPPVNLGKGEVGRKQIPDGGKCIGTRYDEGKQNSAPLLDCPLPATRCGRTRQAAPLDARETYPV
jgi:hypothetical protein